MPPAVTQIHHLWRERLLSLSRPQKRLIQVITDCLLLWLALWLAFWVRLDQQWIQAPKTNYWLLFLLAPTMAIPVFARMGLYRTVMRFMNGQAFELILKAITLASLLFGIAFYFVQPGGAPLPRTVLVIYWLFALLLVCGSRLCMRHFFSPSHAAKDIQRAAAAKTHTPPSRVLIYGAGAAGNQLLIASRMSRDITALGFLDDDPSLAGRIVAGLPVFTPQHLQRIVRTLDIEEILLAMPSAPRKRRYQIMDNLTPFKLKVRTVPGFMDLASGRVSVQDLRQVDIDDLLGRDAVPPRQDLLEQCIRSQVVMVTGAGGSIGSELCRQILTNQPNHLILFEHSEFALYGIHQELTRRFPNAQITPILGSIRNQSRMTEVMAAWKVDTVYHAAAYKHVPMVEHNIAEGLINNTFGTLYAAQAAIRAQVRNFVLISTDKAVRPTNIMGATKRMAELVLQALASEQEVDLYANPHPSKTISNRTRFTMVRFGNVLGSSGSVIPVFREQIRRGGPVTVTHPDITRYFMTIPEAAQLVIQAGAMGKGGDVFVLDMGEPVRIQDLAKKMVQLSGLEVQDAHNPEGDIAIQFSGLRPGEKLYEELLIGDNVLATEHEMIMRAQEGMIPWAELSQELELLARALKDNNYPYVRECFLRLVAGYQTTPVLVDWLHQQQAPKLARTGT